MKLSRASEMGLSNCSKSRCEGFCVVVAVTFDIKIKGEKGDGNFEESHDKVKFRLVIERIANEIRVATVSCV